MAKFHLDRLKHRYNAGEVKGSTYASLMREVIAHNSENVARAVYRLNDETMEKQVQNMKRVSDKRMTLPDMSSVLPQRSVYLRKSAEKGNLITDNLRDKLTKDLREVLQQSHYVSAKGEHKGQMKAQVIKQFEKKILETFSGYTKKDKALGIPKNIHAIAVTETRAVVNNIKNEYMTRLKDENPQVQIKKMWIHNTGLLKYGRKMARPLHLKLNGVTVDIDKPFFAKGKGESLTAQYPHDPSLSAGQVVACQCECVYTMVESSNVHKAKKPIGSISERADGDYKKIGDGSNNQDFFKQSYGEYLKSQK